MGLSLILIVVLGLALLYIPKGELHLLLCARHTPACDIFYRYYTQVAEWFPYVVCVALLLFSQIGDGVLATSGLIFSALTTQFLKHLINAPRPVMWFAEHMPEVQLPLVESVRMNYWFSFPSGHTTSFFALFFALSIILTTNDSETVLQRSGLGQTRKRSYSTFACGLLQAALWALAALGGYSRIYLSQHFAADVFAGMIIGIGITLVCYAVLHRYEDKKWYNYRVFGPKKQENTKK